MKFKKQLQSLGACCEAIRWVGSKSLKEAWNTCERGDWMLWYYFRLKGCDKHLIRAKADCASLVKHLMKDQRSLNAIQACYDYADGKIGVEELKIAHDAARHAATTYNTVYAATYNTASADAGAATSATSAYAAASATSAYAAATTTSASAGAAASANAYNAYNADSYAAFADARYKTLKECANICREVLTKYL